MEDNRACKACLENGYSFFAWRHPHCTWLETRRLSLKSSCCPQFCPRAVRVFQIPWEPWNFLEFSSLCAEPKFYLHSKFEPNGFSSSSAKELQTHTQLTARLSILWSYSLLFCWGLTSSTIFLQLSRSFASLRQLVCLPMPQIFYHTICFFLLQLASYLGLKCLTF